MFDEIVVPALVEVVCFYLVYYNFNYCAAVEYKEGFRVETGSRSINGFLLRIFVFCSGIGNLLYKLMALISRGIAKLSDKWNLPDFIRKYIVRVIDICVFSLFLYIITGWFNVWNASILHDVELTNIAFIDKFIYASSYIVLFTHVLDGDIVLGLLIIFLNLSARFLFYCTIFGFLDCRMKGNLPNKIVKIKFKDQDTEYSAKNDSIQVIITKTCKKIMNTIIDAIASCCYRFVGLGNILTAIIVTIAMTGIFALAIVMEMIKVDVAGSIMSVLPIDSIIGLIEDTVLTVAIVKIGQVFIAERLVIDRIFSRQADNIYQRAEESGRNANAIIESRRIRAEENDVMQNDNYTTSGTSRSRRSQREHTPHYDEGRVNEMSRTMRDSLREVDEEYDNRP